MNSDSLREAEKNVFTTRLNAMRQKTAQLHHQASSKNRTDLAEEICVDETDLIKDVEKSSLEKEEGDSICSDAKLIANTAHEVLILEELIPAATGKDQGKRGF